MSLPDGEVEPRWGLLNVGHPEIFAELMGQIVIDLSVSWHRRTFILAGIVPPWNADSLPVATHIPVSEDAAGILRVSYRDRRFFKALASGL
jgi:hypothetical protein